MSDQKKSNVAAGMYNVEFLKDSGADKKGSKKVYHSSTANTLADKGIVKINGKLKTYKPKKAKDAEE